MLSYAINISYAKETINKYVENILPPIAYKWLVDMLNIFSPVNIKVMFNARTIID